MKIFIVIYLAGMVAGSVGPLPYDLPECNSRAAGFMANAEPDPDVVTSDGYTLADVRLACEILAERPKIDPKFGDD